MSRPPPPSSSSKTHITTESSSDFRSIFEKALKAYNKKIKQDLTAHPLSTQLQRCDSPAAILNILQDQIYQFNQSRSADERLQKWLSPTINVLYAFSETLGEGISLVFSPAKVIFAGAGVLLSAAKEVEASQDIIIDIFERIENFFRRLEVYTSVRPTPAMTHMMVKIMVEVLDILGTATKEMKQSRAKKFLKKIAGISSLEDGLKKLDKMTNEEARMACAESVRVTHEIDKKVEGVDEKVQGVGAQVKDVDKNVKVVDGKVQAIIDDGKQVAMEARQIMQKTAYDVDDVKRFQLRETLIKWQSPSDPSTNHNIASDLQHLGTAEWFCKGNTFDEWKATGSLLWIHGKPGSGKSILCSAIINDIEVLHKAGVVTIAYFYFDFRDVRKQSRSDLLRSLLIQLSARSDPFCDILSQLYRECGNGTRQPSDGALMRCLEKMLILPNQSPVYLIMDALDECPNISGIPTPREQILDLVKELVGLRLSSLHICVTSRPEVNIRRAFEGLAFRSVSLHDESGQSEDITEYIKSVVYSPSDTMMKRWREDDKELVIQALSERADGMFRWVFCQLEMLRHSLPQNVPHILSQLPASLDETYARVLKEIGTTNQVYAYRLLQFLTVARRPLLVEDLAEILAFDFVAEEGIPELKENWRWEDEQEAVLSTCSSLVSVVDHHYDRVVQFSHFSVKEFLTSDRLSTSSADISHFHILPEPAHTVIVKACLGILLHIGHGAADDMDTSSLFRYAADFWTEHVRFEKVWTHVEDGIRRMFDPANPNLERWILHCPDLIGLRGYLDVLPPRSPLYYASACGFHDLAALFVAESPRYLTDVTETSRYLNPLAAALRNRHFDVADLLYERSRDLGIMTNDYNMTLLHAASEEGHVKFVKRLLDHGPLENPQQHNHEAPLRLAGAAGHRQHSISVDTVGDFNYTSLHWASQGGHSELVRELLLRGADITAETQTRRTPLHLASYSMDTESVRLLTESGADVTAQDWRHRTPLHLASGHWPDREFERPNRSGSTSAAGAVQILIDHGADVTAPDVTHSTPLHRASSFGVPDIVQILIENGADVNAQDETHWTPLHNALRSSRPETVRLLIEHGADVTAHDWTHVTPLHVVSFWIDFCSDHLEPNLSTNIARLLIKHGADVTVQDKTYSTPLHVASSLRRGEIVRLFIEHGADVTAKNENHSTPLHLASYCGSGKVVQLLIEHGADVTAQDMAYLTPLHLASSQDGVESVELLIDHGADVMARDGSHRTPLHLALSLRDCSGPYSYFDKTYPTSFGLTTRIDVVRLLIKHGADVTAQDKTCSTPLHMASSFGDNEIVQLFLGHGADISATNETHSTPLHLAALFGSSETVHLLLEHGADATVIDGSHKTALHLALSQSESFDSAVATKTVQLLIEHGVDVTARDESHSTALHLAASLGSLEIVRLLIVHGADVTGQDVGGRTPLHLASSWDDHHHRIPYAANSNMKADTIRLLIDNGGDVAAHDETHSTSLHLASLSGSPETVQLLIEHGADVTTRDWRYRTPLHLASSWDDSLIYDTSYDYWEKNNAKASTVKLLIDCGAEVTVRDENHSTPLHLASSFGGVEIVRLLIERDADVTARDRKHRTPLHLGSSWDDRVLESLDEEKSHAKADTLRLLIDHGADVTAQDETGSTPLHMASSFGGAEAARVLIKHGADVAARDGNHRTSLHLASSRDEGNYEMPLHQDKSNDKADTVQLLIQHGADVTALDDTHSTPLHMASSKRSAETVDLLVRHGADVNARNWGQSTPLHLAASSRLALKGTIVRLLLKHGADVDAVDGEGRTPYQVASSEGNSWIAKLLSDHHAKRG